MHWLTMRLAQVRLRQPSSSRSSVTTSWMRPRRGRHRGSDHASYAGMQRSCGVRRAAERHAGGSLFRDLGRPRHNHGPADHLASLPVAERDGRAAETRVGSDQSWLVRRMLAGLTSKNYNRTGADLLAAAEANPGAIDKGIVNELARSSAATQTWPTDEALKRLLVTRPIYGWVAQPRVVMVLSAVELERRRRNNKTESVFILPPKLTLEHLLPRSGATIGLSMTRRARDRWRNLRLHETQ